MFSASPLTPQATSIGSDSQKSIGPPSNPLLENLDRTVFTFNMHNLAEMCFMHVTKRSALTKL